jgi:hypothetical protein
MADDISKVLETIGSQSKNVDQLTKSLEKLSAVKKDALAAGDVSSLLAYSKMEKSIKRLMVATEKYTDAQNDLKKAQEAGVELSEEQLQALNAVSKEYNDASRVVKDYQKVAVDAHEKIRQKVEQNKKETTEYWKANTLLGQGWEWASGKLAKYTAGLTFSGLAMKALNRHIEATELRQNLLIQSNMGLDKAVTQTKKGIGGYTDYVVDSAAATAKVTQEALVLSEVMADVEGAAVRMGVSTDVVSDSMMKFSKIVGTDSPQMLGKLTKGAITVSRAMGITTAEAVDFVSLRMDKFGGSAAGAIVALNQINKSTRKTNEEFGRTVIRSSDVVKTLSDISRQTNMYAIDQRFVGNILRDNSARLQANGDSYEMAQQKAQAYTKAVTGEAPEWMQVYSGIDVYGQIEAGLEGKEGAKTLNDTIGSELEAASPGLRKKVEDIMNDSTIAYYDKMRVIQEATKGSTIGVDAMNKQIMKLATNPNGLTLISKQFNVSMEVARGMKTQAIDAAKAADMLGSRLNMNNEELAESLEMDQDKLEALIGIDKSEANRKKVIKSITDEQSREKTVEDDIARLKVQDETNEKAKAAIRDRIKMLQEAVAKANADSDSATAKHATKLLEESQDELSRYEAKETKKDTETEGLKTVEEINRELLTQFKPYATNTGRDIKGLLTEMSSTKMLLLAAVGANVIHRILKKTEILPRIADLLAKRSLGGGGDDGGGSEIPDMEGKDKKGEGKKGKKGEDKKSKRDMKRERKAQARKATSSSRMPKGRGMRLGGLRKVGSSVTSMGSKAISSGAGFLKGMGGGLAGAMLPIMTDMFADKLETSGGDMKAISDSFLGPLETVAGGLAMLPGPLGAVGKGLSVGLAAGKLFNKGLDMLGVTSEKVGDGLMWLANKTGPLGKFAAFISGGETEKSKKETDKELIEGGGNVDPKASKAKLSKSASNRGMALEDYMKAMEQAEAKKMKLGDYLDSIGKKRTNATVSAPPAGTMDVAKQAAATKQANKQTVVLPKETKTPPGNIPAPTAAALKVSGVTTAEATQMAADARAREQASQTSQAGQTSTASTSGDSGAMPGSFVGGIQGDGSVMLKVDNFMQVMAQAQTKIKSGTRGPG